MKMSRMKKGLAAGWMVLVILSAVYRINIHLCPDFHAYDGVCWSIVGYECLLLAGGYGLAAVALGRKKRRRMRKGAASTC